jgi:hypothetical protein
VSESAPLRTPMTDGVKVMEIVQLALAASDEPEAGQVLLAA